MDVFILSCLAALELLAACLLALVGLALAVRMFIEEMIASTKKEKVK